MSRTAFGLVRGESWWHSKIPPVLLLASIQILLRRLEPAPALPRLAALLVSASLLAAWAHVVNNLFDLEADRLAGKGNSLAGLTSAQRILLCAGLAVAGLVPWLLVPPGGLTVLVLAAILLVPIAYSAPPLRLKGRGVLGPLADAAYAHAVPALFVGALFAATPGAPPVPSARLATSISVLWSFLFGLRGILLHQVWDLPNDLRAGTQTYVARIGPERTRLLTRRLLFPLELASIGCLLLALRPTAPALLWSFLVYLLFDLVKLRWAWRKPFDPLPAGPGTYLPLFDFYLVWMPLVAAVLATVRDTRFGILLVVQIGFAGELVRCLSDAGSVGILSVRRVRSAIDRRIQGR